MAGAQQAAQQLQKTARTAAGEAELMTARARSMQVAASAALEGAEGAARLAELEAEREELTGQVAELTRRSRDLIAEQEQQDKALAAARDVGDLDKMTAAKSRIAAISDLATTLGGRWTRRTGGWRRSATGRRPERRGDGTETCRRWSRPARRPARGKSEAFRIADQIWPDSPGAPARQRCRRTPGRRPKRWWGCPPMGGNARRHQAARFGPE